MQYKHEPYIMMEMRMLDKHVPDNLSMGDICGVIIEVNALGLWKCLATFYLLSIAPKWGTNMNARTNFFRDGLQSSIFEVQTEELSIIVRVVYRGFHGD